MKNSKINIVLIILAIVVYHIVYHYFNSSLVAQERSAIQVTGNIVLNCTGENVAAQKAGAAGENTTLNCTGQFASSAQ